MEVEFKKDNYSVTKRYELTDKEIEIMKFISKHERIDFRERKYGAENPKDESGTFFYDDCFDLIGQDFIKEDDNWWNSYVFTALGTYFVEGNHLFQEEVENGEKKQ
jgi:hypothetical protein